MGKRKEKGTYNDFLDGEKLRDNAEIRTSLPGASSSATPITSMQQTTHWGRPQEAQDEGKTNKAATKKPPLTHFLCLPLVNPESKPQLRDALEGFVRDVEIGSGRPYGGLVPVKAVRPLGTLHLTLGVMSLSDEEAVNAGKCLQDLDLKSILRDASSTEMEVDSTKGKEEAVGGTEGIFTPLVINLQSLVPMHAPSKTSILYAEPRDPSARLYPFAEALRLHFTEKGFLVEDTRELKLHATIVNTIYAKPRGPKGRGKAGNAAGGAGGRSEGHGPAAKSWMRFDASGLVEDYAEMVWAKDVGIDRVQICRMGAKKVVGDDGEVVDEKYEVVFEKVI